MEDTKKIVDTLNSIIPKDCNAFLILESPEDVALLFDQSMDKSYVVEILEFVCERIKEEISIIPPSTPPTPQFLN